MIYQAPFIPICSDALYFMLAMDAHFLKDETKSDFLSKNTIIDSEKRIYAEDIGDYLAYINGHDPCDRIAMTILGFKHGTEVLLS